LPMSYTNLQAYLSLEVKAYLPPVCKYASKCIQSQDNFSVNVRYIPFGA